MAGEMGVPKLLSIRQLEERTGVARWRWYELIARGKGPPTMRLGRTLRVSEAALAQWIEEQGRKANEERLSQ